MSGACVCNRLVNTGNIIFLTEVWNINIFAVACTHIEKKETLSNASVLLKMVTAETLH
jgi:hypothetical protein